MSLRGRIGLAGSLLGIYQVGMGVLVRRVPGFEYGGCPVGQPCDPLIVHRYAGLGLTLLVSGATLGVLSSFWFLWMKRRPSGRAEPTRMEVFARFVLYAAAVFVVALGVFVLVTIWRSPVSCEGGGMEQCPPDSIADLLFIVLGGNLTAVALIMAAGVRSRAQLAA